MGCQNCQKVRTFARFCRNPNVQVAVSKKNVYWKVGSLLYVKCMVFVQRNIKLSVYPQLFVISLSALQKVGNCWLKPIFEVLYLLNNALKYIYPI